MIPVDQIGLELVLGLGAALVGANLWVLLRPSVARLRGGPPAPKPRSLARVVIQMALGAAMFGWAFFTLIARG